MKKAFLFILLAISLTSCEEVVNTLSGDSQIVQGLKEALRVGTDSAVHRLSAKGGYLDDAAVKIGLPEDAVTTFRAVQSIYAVPAVQTVMKAAGMDLTSDFENVLITAFNEAAENAAPQAANIFVSAITDMTIADGKTILFSSDTIAATKYLRTSTETKLTLAFSPVISNSMNNVHVGDYTATTAWTFFAEQNNKLAEIAEKPAVKTALMIAQVTNSEGVSKITSTISAIKPVPTDLGDYVTGKALNGLFTKVGNQEHKIRTDATARVNKLLQDVFGQLDK